MQESEDIWMDVETGPGKRTRLLNQSTAKPVRFRVTTAAGSVIEFTSAFGYTVEVVNKGDIAQFQHRGVLSHTTRRWTPDQSWLLGWAGHFARAGQRKEQTRLA